MISRRNFTLFLTAAIFFLSDNAYASRKRRGRKRRRRRKRYEHDDARRERDAGRIMPLREILARISPRFPGELIDVELEREDGYWIYDLTLIGRDHHKLEIRVDARNARVLRVRGK